MSCNDMTGNIACLHAALATVYNVPCTAFCALPCNVLQCILILLSFPVVPINIYTTHKASKLATPLRFITLLPCPADQSSATLKSVQWNCVDPISRPGQPRSHVMVPGGPIKVPADTVLALQKVSSLDLRQEIRCVKTIYKCNRLLWYC